MSNPYIITTCGIENVKLIEWPSLKVDRFVSNIISYVISNIYNRVMLNIIMLNVLTLVYVLFFEFVKCFVYRDATVYLTTTAEVSDANEYRLTFRVVLFVQSDCILHIINVEHFINIENLETSNQVTRKHHEYSRTSIYI